MARVFLNWFLTDQSEKVPFEQKMEEKECILCEDWIRECNAEAHFNHEHGIDNPIVDIHIGGVRVVYDGRFVETDDDDVEGDGADGGKSGADGIVDAVGAAQHKVAEFLDDLLGNVIDKAETNAIVDVKCELAFAKLDADDLWGSLSEADDAVLDTACKNIEMIDGDFDEPFGEDDVKVEPMAQCKEGREVQDRQLGNIAEYVSGQRSFLRAVILSVSGPRTVATNLARQGSFSNLTLCDDAGASINLSVWSEYGQNNVSGLCVGQVVQVRHAQVLSRENLVHDRLDPEVSCVKKLKYVDGVTTIQRLDARFFKNLQEKLHRPYDGNGVEVSLLDIQGPEMLSKYVTVLGEVVEIVANIKVSDTRVMTALTIRDGAVMAKVKVWERQHRTVANSWAVGQKVQLSGLLVEWDHFRGMHCLAGSSRSVFLSM